MREAPRWSRRLGRGFLLALAVGLVASAYARFLQDPEGLFTGLAHDRHTHYRAVQRLATDLRAGDLLAFLHDVERERTWPPLHALLAAGPVALAGVDFRAAPVVSAVGWLLALVFAFLAARRAAPAHGDLAGLLAGLLVAASPAHRRFATDVMLESLGAALTLAGLHFFLGWLRGRSTRDARAFAIALSGLLLLKYNYYLLAVASFGAAGLALAAGEARGRAALRQAAAHIRAAAGPFLARRVRDPATWGVVLLLVAAAAVSATGGGRFEVLGRRVSITHASNVVHLAWVVALARLGLWLAGRGRRSLADAPPDLRALVAWHGAPLAVWFALPRRLGSFAAHVAGPESVPVPSRWLLYARGFAADYHGEGWAGGLCVALVAVGVAVAVAHARSLGPTARAAIVFAGSAAGLTLLHPSAESRFLHSWIGAVWVVAAVGFALLLRGTARVRGAAAAHALAALLLMPALVTAAAGVLQPQRSAPPSRRVFPLADALFPAGIPSGRVAVASSSPAEEFFEWSFVERGGARDRLTVFTPADRPGLPERRRAFESWLDRAGDACLLLLDVPPGSPLHVPRHPDYDELGRAFATAAGPVPALRLDSWSVTLRARSCAGDAREEADVSPNASSD